MDFYGSNNNLWFSTVNIIKEQIKDNHTLKVPIVINYVGNCFQLQTNNVLLWARFVIKGSPFITNPFVMSFIIKDDFLSAPVNYAVCYNQLFSLKPLLFNNYQSNYK